MMNSYPIAILAGGIATRLRPITETIPKALVELNGDPFLAHQLRLLEKNGIRKVIICAGYLGEMIEEYVRKTKSIDLDIRFSFDGDTLLGTGGALKKALPLLGDTFFVIYGDSYLPCSYSRIQQYFSYPSKLALMTVYKNDNKWDKSNVLYQEGRILKYDKKETTPDMHHLDYGLGLFRSAAFELFSASSESERSAFDLEELYQFLLSNNQLAAYEVEERFYEIGSFDGLEETKRYLMVNTVNNE